MSAPQLNLFEKLLVLAGESTVDVNLLATDEGLIALIRSGMGQEACLEYVNNNY